MICTLLALTLFAATPADDLFPDEPTVREVQEQAVRHALVSEPDLARLTRDAKWEKLLPRTSVHLRKATANNQDIAVDPEGNRTLTFIDNLGDQYDVQVEWHLDELMMGPERVQAIRETARLVALRDEILDEVTKLWFDRRRAQLETEESPNADSRARAARQLRIDELTARLDGLTGGWFGDRLRAAGEKPR